MPSLIRTGVLLAALTAVFVAAGFLIAGKTGLIIAFPVALAINAYAYWFSADLLLRGYGARPVTRSTDPALHGLVAEMASRASLPTPRVYLIDSPQPNAFATGRNPANAAIAVTTGLVRLLTRDELAGVISHELAHVRNYDTLIMTVAASIAGAVAMLADPRLVFGSTPRDRQGQSNGPGLIGGLLIIILAPLAAALVQMAISRTREYEADRLGAAISGQPLRLADALMKIHQGVRQTRNPAAEARPATALLFIINPLFGSRMSEWFATHPPTGERVRRLRLMAGTVGGAEIGRLARAAGAPGAVPGAVWRG
ncbi:MAG: M48 family metalloprotease [Rhodospirillaceae bacterium]